MNTLWKALAALALVVPLGAYAAGSLASASQEPAPRRTIVIDDAPSRSGSPAADPTHSPRPASSPAGSVRLDPDDLDDSGDDWGRDDHSGSGDSGGRGSDDGGHGSGGGHDDRGGSGGGGTDD